MDALEDKIGSNLFADLGRTPNSSTEMRNTSETETTQEKGLTLENLILAFEKDLQHSKRENAMLKDGIGQRLAETLLNAAVRDEGSPAADDQFVDVSSQGEEQGKRLQLSSEKKKAAEKGGELQIEQSSLDDSNESSKQPLGRDNCSDEEVENAGSPGDLKTESLITDEGRTIEDILRSYERQIEALRKLASKADAISVADLVKNYEDKVGSLSKENDNLVKRLEKLEQKIGNKLFKEVEGRESERALKDNVDLEDEERLKAPRIMNEEQRTLENVIRTYEKELSVLRKIIPSGGDEGSSITGLVKEYEDKLDILRTENDSVRNESERLQNRIGHDLVNEIKKMEQIIFDTTEDSDFEVSGPVKDLKVAKIMDVKESTLEEVIETYESALGKLLSDTSVSVEDLMPEKFTDEQDRSFRVLKQENEILRGSVGLALAQKLLNMARDRKDAPDFFSDNEEGTNVDNELLSMKQTTETLSKDIVAPEKLLAETLVREEGRTIENILKNYEKELETLKALVLNGSGKPTDTFSDLVRKYEDEADELKKQNRGLENQLDALKGKIGSDLMKELEHQLDGESVECVLKSELNVPHIMEVEDKTLESVIKCYEKELEVLRKQAPCDGEDQVSVPDIIKEYEDQLASLKGERDSSRKDLIFLEDKLGRQLVDDLKKLDEKTFENNTEKSEMNGTKNKLRAPNIMRKERVTLGTVLETYEDTINKEAVAEHYLKSVNDLKNENGALKTALGEELTRTILDAAMGDSSEVISDDASLQSAVGKHQGDLDYRSHGTMASVITRAKSRTPYDEGLEELEEKNKEDEINYTIAASKNLKANTLIRDEGKTVENILKNYENQIKALSKLVPREEDPGYSTADLIKSYEDKINCLEMDNSSLNKRLELLTERIGRSLADEMLNPKEEGQGLPLNAVKLIMNDGKTVSDVFKEYENDLERMKREIRELASQDSKASFLIEKVVKYEDEISELKSKRKEKTAFEKKVGVELSKQIMALVENVDGKGQENATFRAVEVMRNDRDVTLCDVIKEYEEELEKKNHEVLALKELISNDMLDIATSQESEISELKKVHAVLANELDLLSARIGQELSNELLKRTAQQPTPNSVKLYREVIQKMEDDGKPLQSILEDLDQKIKLMRGENEELKNNKNLLAGVSGKIGEELLDQLLSSSESDGTRARGEPLFEALEVMSREEKTLGDVILMHEKEKAKLKRENEALRLLTDNDSTNDSSVTDILSEYEGKIEMLGTENEELHKQMDQITQRVGVELTQELLKLPYEVCKSTTEGVKELGALKTLQEDKRTLTDVLQNYEQKLRGRDEEDLGPLVSGQLKTEEIKLAQLVRIGETEPENPVSKESRIVQEAKSDNEMAMKPNAKDFEDSIKSTRPDSQDGIKKLSDENARLHKKLQQLSKKVGKELTEELMRSSGDEDNEVIAAVNFATVRDLKAFNDVNAERATLAQVLESYEKKLEETMRRDNERPDESHSVAVEIKPSHLARAGECTDDVSEIVEEEIVSQYEAPDGDLDRDGKKGVDDQELPQLSDLDLMPLEDLVLEKPHSDESLPLYQRRPSVKEDIVQVEASQHEESFNIDFEEILFASDIPVADKEVSSKTADSHMTESKVGAEEDERIENLERKVKELENALEEEKHLKERYQKDVQDLLQDIVELKMKQVEDDDDNPEEIRKKIQDDIDLRQDNTRLQEDLKKEKRRRLSVEESKRDLLDEVDNLMREKEMLLKQQNEPSDGEKLLEDMINLRKKIGDLDTKNRNLQKEVTELKETITELDASHDEEKNKLFATYEKEKSDMMEEHVASKRELEIQLQELLAMNEDLKRTIKNLLEELKESNGRLVLDGGNAIARERKGTEKDQTGESVANLTEQEKEEGRKTMYEWKKNENLKEQTG